MISLYLVFAVLMLAALASLVNRNEKFIYVVNILAGVVTVAGIFMTTSDVLCFGAVAASYFYVDALSAVMLLALGVLALSGTIVSMEYLRRENLPVSRKGQYYFLLQIFVLSMLLVVVFDNAGLVWVAVEATTIISAMLVVFHQSRQSLEAAWKYVIICSIGICLALLGTILLYYSQVSSTGEAAASLNWQALKQAAPGYDPRLALLAFLFIVIGYGAKAGFAPMHTWLPDAHSQAPAPISALLSGGLIATAVYVLIRNVIIFKAVLQPAVWQGLLAVFALLSIVIVVPFMYKQNDIKRLLAYSSIENIGIMTLGLVGNCYLAVFGLMFHIFNHALNKSALFYLAGEIISVFRTKQISRISALTESFPAFGWILVAGIISIVGLPPSAVFFSKLYIIFGLISGGYYLIGVVALLAVAVIFMLLLKAMLKMCFGPKQNVKIHQRPSTITLAVAAALLLLLAVFGIVIPNGLMKLVEQSAAIILK